MVINMPVEVLNEKCLHCRDLELDVVTKEKYGLDIYGDALTEPNAKDGFVCENAIRCMHYDTCKWRAEHIFREEPAKKTTSKVSAAKTSKTAKPAVKTMKTAKKETKK